MANGRRFRHQWVLVSVIVQAGAVLTCGPGVALLSPPQGASKIESEIAVFESHVKAKDYAAWKTREPNAATRALILVVSQLGAFEATERTRASALISMIGDDGVSALVLTGLPHPNLAVRVGAYDTLLRILQTKYGMTPASIPQYDAWAPAKERTQRSQALAKWWAQRRTSTKGRIL